MQARLHHSVPTAPWAGLLQLLAFVCLSVTVHIGQGLYTPSAMPWLLMAVACAVLSQIPAFGRNVTVRHVDRWLFAGAGVNLMLLLGAPPTKHLQLASAGDVVWFFVLLIPAILVAGGGMLRAASTRFTKYQPLLLVLTWSLPMVWVIVHAPRPLIDVFNLQQESAGALVHGTNPYAMTFEDMYHGDPGKLGPGISVKGTIVFGYPYLPESLYLSTVGELLAGDHRAAHLAAFGLTALLMVGIGRASGAAPTVVAGACAMFLFMPANAHVIESSWSEPLVGLTLAGCVYCAMRCGRMLPVAVGLFLASKQYTFIFLPATLLLLRSQLGWRGVARFYGIALVTALVVTLPLVLWDVEAFYRSAIFRHTLAPFRSDALTFQSWLAFYDIHLPRAAGLIAAVPVMFLIIRYGRRTPAGFASAVGATTVVFFAFSHQAFVNYYLPAFAAWACAVVATPHSVSLTSASTLDAPSTVLRAAA